MHPILRAAAALSLASFGAACAAAQSYPSRPITLIVPTVPGGAADAISRVLADDLAKRLGQSIIVENRPGAGGVVGTKIASNAPADGHTLLLGIDSALTVAPYLLPEPPYRPTADFTPISQVCVVQFMLVAAPGTNITSARALLDAAKAAPGQITYASGGVGSIHQLAMERFQAAAGIQLRHIPYKAAPQGFGDLMGGHVSVMFIANGTGHPAIAGGKATGLGTAGAQADGALAPLNQTVPDFTFESWFGLYAPAGTPQDVVDKLAASTRAALNDPTVAEKFRNAGVLPNWSDAATLAARAASDTENYRDLLQKLQDTER